MIYLTAKATMTYDEYDPTWQNAINITWVIIWPQQYKSQKRVLISLDMLYLQQTAARDICLHNILKYNATKLYYQQMPKAGFKWISY